MSEVIDIRTYEPSPQDRIFFDNNVWIMLLSGIGNYAEKEQKIYSAFFEKIQRRNIKIAINSMLLSEYANRALRLGFNLWTEHHQKIGADYKRDYVGTKEFQEKVQQVRTHLTQIVAVSDKYSDEFNALNLNGIFQTFGSVDFNDAYFIHYSMLKKFKVVTRDRDFLKFRDAGLEVITHLK